MKICISSLAVILAALPCAAQSANLSDWPKLIDRNDAKGAKELCSAFVGSKDIAQQVEAQKCLANAALSGNGVIMLEGDNAGGGNIRQGYKPESVDEALVHLNAGLKLAPQDLTIHMGRLHVLEVSGRYAEMVEALDESCTLYTGKDVPDAWLAYSPELNDLRQYEAGLEFMKVLDKHYPKNPDILGNVGAFFSDLKRPKEAIPYLEEAAGLAPMDPINAWDLGRAYDYTDQLELADKWYQKGLSLMKDPDQHTQSLCLYARFIETKLHEGKRACGLEKKNCSADEQTACTAGTKESKTSK
jgi:tetratricopeptide (TPR) repeat protein